MQRADRRHSGNAGSGRSRRAAGMREHKTRGRASKQRYERHPSLPRPRVRLCAASRGPRAFGGEHPTKRCAQRRQARQHGTMERPEGVRGCCSVFFFCLLPPLAILWSSKASHPSAWRLPDHPQRRAPGTRHMPERLGHHCAPRMQHGRQQQCTLARAHAEKGLGRRGARHQR